MREVSQTGDDSNVPPLRLTYTVAEYSQCITRLNYLSWIIINSRAVQGCPSRRTDKISNKLRFLLHCRAKYCSKHVQLFDNKELFKIEWFHVLPHFDKDISYILSKLAR